MPGIKGRRGGGASIGSEAAARVREALRRLREGPYAGYGGVTRLAKAIGVTQPAITQILDGGGISPETAVRVAELAQMDATALLGSSNVSEKYPNLKVALDYHGTANWKPATLAAAQAGLWPDDVSAKEWARRLDELEKRLVDVVKTTRSPN